MAILGNNLVKLVKEEESELKPWVWDAQNKERNHLES